MAANMNFLYENITNKILNLLKTGVSPWKKSWKAANMPVNMVTKYPYRGINVWLLLSSPFASQNWITYNQLKKLNGTIKSGEEKNYETIIFFKIVKYDRAGEEQTYPMIRYTRVWNIEQVNLTDEQIEKLIPKVEVREVNKIKACEDIVKNYKDCPEIKHGGDKAYYAPMFDNVQMPVQIEFDNDESYYNVLFHELGHSTGAPKRLNRFKVADSNIFGSDTYSKEELVAEMTASFLSAETGIGNDLIENTAAYISGWSEAIKNGDRNFVISAASKAQAAADYILQKMYKKA
jgi:antirestriction protein ArdC